MGSQDRDDHPSTRSFKSPLRIREGFGEEMIIDDDTEKPSQPETTTSNTPSTPSSAIVNTQTYSGLDHTPITVPRYYVQILNLVILELQKRPVQPNTNPEAEAREGKGQAKPHNAEEDTYLKGRITRLHHRIEDVQRTTKGAIKKAAERMAEMNSRLMQRNKDVRTLTTQNKKHEMALDRIKAKLNRLESEDGAADTLDDKRNSNGEGGTMKSDIKRKMNDEDEEMGGASVTFKKLRVDAYDALASIEQEDKKLGDEGLGNLLALDKEFDRVVEQSRAEYEEIERDVAGHR